MGFHRIVAWIFWSTAVVGLPAAVASEGRRSDAVRELVSAANAEVTVNPVTRTARHARFASGAVVADGTTAGEKAELFLLRHGRAFGIDAPGAQLELRREGSDSIGHAMLVFDQVHHGIPVFGGRLGLHFDAGGQLIAAAGSVLPDIDVEDLRPSLSEGEAVALARALIVKEFGLDPAALVIAASQLVVFHDGVIWGRDGRFHLCWRLEISDQKTVSEHLFIDAHSGRIVNRISGLEQIRRFIYENSAGNLVWQEGDPLPYSGSGEVLRDREINSLIEVAEQTYNTFLNISGRTFLSWTGTDAPMRSFYDRDGMSCPNAYFDGSSTSFCVGTATDDVIAHEWTHGYTRQTHGLVYQWQPGALNEGYSDIFGEVVDLLFDSSGSDNPSGVRESETCSTATTLDEPELIVEEPASLAGPMAVRTATFNPSPPWSVTAPVEQADDGVGNGNDACDPLVGFTPGNIAVITMGACTERFVTPVSNAEAAGAVGAIVVNPLNDNLTVMNGAGRLGIPAVFLGRSDGQALRDALAEGVVVTMRAGGDGSLRWLVAEDSSAFGGAIRDMWNPECLGDPARVSSANYACSESDNGGVHTNSGVPNQAFALLVDGGSSNDVEVPAIGLTRAAHIYWRAMTVYQFPLSDFRDHADLLASSCQDLIGQPLPDLLNGQVAPEVVTPDDCLAVEAAMAATEMRRWPSQCRFDTILDPDPPIQPGGLEVFSESFDGPPTGWTVSNRGVYPEYQPRDWIWTDQAPDGAVGGVFYAMNSPTLGNCQAGSDDQSGVMYLESPAIELPFGTRPIVTFDHYVATEKRVDGGNLKISVNGGPFVLVPAEAFLFNPYNDVLREPEWNDNPLAGEGAFVGTDATTYRGSWGQSQAHLGGLASVGDTVVLRFDFGADGCNGQDGWYLDNVRLIMQPRERLGTKRVAPQP